MGRKAPTRTVLCIVCPEGCEIRVREEEGRLVFARGVCARGRTYAEEEVREPARVLTTTVPVSGGAVAMLPVRTAAPVPKPRLAELMGEIKRISVTAPVRMGDIIVPDLGGTGVALVASRDVAPDERHTGMQPERPD